MIIVHTNNLYEIIIMFMHTNGLYKMRVLKYYIENKTLYETWK